MRKCTQIVVLAFIIYNLPCIILKAQTSKIDSFENLLVKQIEVDTPRINRLIDTAYASYRSDIEKTFTYAALADSLSKIINFKKGEAESLKLLAKYYRRKSDYSIAMEYYEKAIEYYKELEIHKGAAICYNDIGIIYWNQGNYPQALEFFQKSLTIKKTLNDQKGIGIVYTNFGNIYFDQGNYTQALEYHLKSLKIHEELDDKKRMSKCYNNIGIIYKQQGEYSKALKYYADALKIKEHLGDKTGMAKCYNNMGVVFKQQDDYTHAIQYYHKCLKLMEELGNKKAIGMCYNNLGIVHKLQDDFDKALDFFLKALDIAKDIGSQSSISKNNLSISALYNEQKKYSLAQTFGEKAFTIAVGIGEKEKIMNAAENLANIYSGLGNYKKAYQYHLKYNVISDSLFNEDNIKKITALEYEYKYEKEKEILANEQAKKDAVNAAEASRMKTLRNSFFIGFLFMVIVAVLIFWSFLQKRKANFLLAQQKNIIQETNGRLNQKNEALNQTNEELKTSIETVNQQKKKLTEQHETVNLQKNQITASIKYASRLQSAVLPSKELLKEILPEHFILFMPLDIVSGDFYWAKKVGHKIFIAIADCTGHGVPGAFLSILGISYLNDIVQKEQIEKADQVLNELRLQIKYTLRQTGDYDKTPDGMDLAFCIIDSDTNKLQYAGAYNPLFIIRKNKLIEFHADKQPIGVHWNEAAFTNNEFQLEKGDTIYAFTDGYIDQFGGVKKSKFLLSRFKNILQEIHSKPLKDQKKTLEKIYHKWKDKEEQTDDVLIMGIKI